MLPKLLSLEQFNILYIWLLPEYMLVWFHWVHLLPNSNCKICWLFLVVGTKFRSLKLCLTIFTWLYSYCNIVLVTTSPSFFYLLFFRSEECPFLLCVWVCVLHVACHEFVVPLLVFICSYICYETLHVCMSLSIVSCWRVWWSVALLVCAVHMWMCVSASGREWILRFSTSYIFRHYFSQLPFSGYSVSMTKPCYHGAPLGR